MRIFIKILLFLFCIGCNNSGSKETKYETNLSKANVSRITERLQVMIVHNKFGDFPEDLKLITNSVVGYIESQTIYDEDGKAVFIYIGGTEGFIAHSLYPQKGYLPFSISQNSYHCSYKINKNYIIETAAPRTGEVGYSRIAANTIRNFVIIPKDKIILSKDDYKLLRKAKSRDEFGARYILYRYE